MKEPLHPEEIVTSFVLIRHGDTTGTQDQVLYSDKTTPLTEKGQLQAKALARWLPQEKPEVLLTSPAERVRTTAFAIAGLINLNPVVIEDLDEWRVGLWEGKNYWDIKKATPDQYMSWSADPIHNAPPGGESIVDLCRRVERKLKDLIRAYEGKRIALVTHAGVVRGILVFALGVPVENFWRVVIPTGSVSKVDFSQNFATVHYLGLRPGALA